MSWGSSEATSSSSRASPTSESHVRSTSKGTIWPPSSSPPTPASSTSASKWSIKSRTAKARWSSKWWSVLWASKSSSLSTKPRCLLKSWWAKSWGSKRWSATTSKRWKRTSRCTISSLSFLLWFLGMVSLTRQNYQIPLHFLQILEVLQKMLLPLVHHSNVLGVLRSHLFLLEGLPDL